MKTLLISIALLSLALGQNSLVAASAARPAASSSGAFESFVLNLRPGSSPAEVRRVLGAPAAMLNRDLWIYWNFSDPNPNRGNPAYDTLVIAFTHERVTAVKITDGRVVRQLLAQNTSYVEKSAVAAK